tara:strand:- start:32098 stop:32376 length:279 start_codon:yes stop_codon:yes gene_type:complete
MRTGIIDDHGRLIGEETDGDGPEIGDLPADGSYKHVDGQFIPVTHGHGKPKPPGVSRDRALRLLIDAVETGAPVPQECKDWAEWFDKFGDKR